MEMNYKVQQYTCISDVNPAYTIFDMRKAYNVDKESILAKLEQTSLDNSNKKQKYGSYESNKVPKGQGLHPIIFHSKVKSNN